MPALWMANEASAKGLKLEPSNVKWDFERFKTQKPVESLKNWWIILEWLPFLSHKRDFPEKPHRWCLPHCRAPRFIYPGQKIHLSVALKENYRPKARFRSPGSANQDWDSILNLDINNFLQNSSNKNLQVEIDLFDVSAANQLVKKNAKMETKARTASG